MAVTDRLFTTRRSLLTEKIAPMLAYSSKPFDSVKHLFEIKWDGSRCLLFLQDGRIRLQNRRLQDITGRYPELGGLAEKFRINNAILDGELVVLSEGQADFRRLQQREQLSDPFKIDLMSRRLPATYIAFDLLFLNDRRYLEVPLRERKRVLRTILPDSDLVVESRFIEGQGKAFFQEAVSQGLEGIMAKALASPYLIGQRSRHWLKIKPRGAMECYVVGYSPGRGGRGETFGSLALASREPRGWLYRGLVGSGFSEAELQSLSRQLGALRVENPPAPLNETVKGIHWVRPQLRCRVSFHEITPRGHFRAPAFEGLLP